ncbi:MAG: tetratricopeptide repeat protein, partial [Nitrospinae bacterium]|nr:tetratricopeptide repeat protein [Nitrospinota bacterium]
GGRYYQQAVSKSDSDPGAHFGLALYYRYKSEYEKAEEQLQKAMALDYKNPKYKRELEDMRSEKVAMAQGILKQHQAIAENPDDPSQVAQLGRFYLRWGKYEQAEKQFKKAIELAFKLPDTPEAAEDPDDPDIPIVKEPSKVPEYASNLGWFYFKDLKYEKAEKAFKSALKIDPKYTEALFGLGRAYENLKQYELAASHYAQTVASDPEHKEAQDHLAALKESGKLVPIVEVDMKPGVATDKQTVEEVKK